MTDEKMKARDEAAHRIAESWSASPPSDAYYTYESIASEAWDAALAHRHGTTATATDYDQCSEKLARLANRLGFDNSGCYDFDDLISLIENGLESKNDDTTATGPEFPEAEMIASAEYNWPDYKDISCEGDREVFETGYRAGWAKRGEVDSDRIYNLGREIKELEAKLATHVRWMREANAMLAKYETALSLQGSEQSFVGTLTRAAFTIAELKNKLREANAEIKRLKKGEK